MGIIIPVWLYFWEGGQDNQEVFVIICLLLPIWAIDVVGIFIYH